MYGQIKSFSRFFSHITKRFCLANSSSRSRSFSRIGPTGLGILEKSTFLVSLITNTACRSAQSWERVNFAACMKTRIRRHSSTIHRSSWTVLGALIRQLSCAGTGSLRPGRTDGMMLYRADRLMGDYLHRWIHCYCHCRRWGSRFPMTIDSAL